MHSIFGPCASSFDSTGLARLSDPPSAGRVLQWRHQRSFSGSSLCTCTATASSSSPRREASSARANDVRDAVAPQVVTGTRDSDRGSSAQPGSDSIPSRRVAVTLTSHFPMHDAAVTRTNARRRRSCCRLTPPSHRVSRVLPGSAGRSERKSCLLIAGPHS